MITQNQLNRIATTIQAHTLDETMLPRLRSENPGVHFTYCLDDDILNYQPVFEGTGFNLYLIDSREHCLSLTCEQEHASGVVVAEIIHA